MMPDPHDILLKITRQQLFAGSDLHLYSNEMLDMHDGDILGHEFMKIIGQTGEQVKKFKLLEMVPGGVDCSLEAAAGTIAIIGVYNNVVNHFPIGLMMEKHLTVVGGQFYAQKHWETCLDQIRSGEFDPTFVISHRLTLSQVPDYYKGRSFRRLDPLKSESVPVQLFSIPAGIAQEISDQFLTVSSSKFAGNGREMTGTYV
ncbi:unnamed protein product [Adineta ricciae]|uniref:Uncharacterized protein n=1 Tax=Adineta ricciae TaxID=249248 RepID=A0A814X6B7_ADIRI|nr:unnamed protein product [Adineta ricciae]CAF1370440.1 unnamed protein product [Adineta ricciae]